MKTTLSPCENFNGLMWFFLLFVHCISEYFGSFLVQLCRVHTGPENPGKSWNFKWHVPGLESPGKSWKSKTSCRKVFFDNNCLQYYFWISIS